MKKQLLIISIIVVIAGIFVSCSANSSSQEVSTTAVTDSKGTTHYYEPVSDENSTSVYAEIVTDDKGKAVTNKNGTYVTKEYTTILPIKDETTKPSTSAEPTAEKSSGTTKHKDDTQADNIVSFEPDKSADETKPTASSTSEKPTEATAATTTAQKETRPATDKDGWITKWY